MPIREVELAADGGIASEMFWTYDTDRKTVGEYPPEFFAIGMPADPNKRVEVEQERDRMLPIATDVETATDFEPRFLGLDVNLPGLGTFCFSRNDKNTVTPNPATQARVPIGNEDTGIPAATSYVADTFVTAAYHLGVVGTCASALLSTDELLTVTTFARNSTSAAAWRAVFAQDGNAQPVDPASPWLLQEGLLPVIINGLTATAYLVPGASGNTSALIDIGDATVVITGPFDANILTALIGALRSQQNACKMDSCSAVPGCDSERRYDRHSGSHGVGGHPR